LNSTTPLRYEPPEQPVSLPFGIEPVQFVAFFYGAWLFALTLLFYLEPENKIMLEVVLLSGSGPALLQALFLPADTRGNGPGLWFMWAFLAIFLASYVLNGCTWEDLVNLFNVMFVFLLGTVIASSRDPSLIRRIVVVYALIMAPFLLYINIFGERVWGRLHAGAQPNVWGLLSLNVALGAFALKRRLLQIAVFAIVLLTMYNAQTRGSMVALIPILFIYAYHWYAYEKGVDITWKMLVTYAGIAVVFSIVAFYSDFILNEVLRLNDPYRGLTSGATGRDEAWGEALRLWYNNPLLGVGFRKHENMMVITALSAHNAYLAMLADTGFLGFLTYMAFLVSAAVCTLRGITDNKLRLFIFAVIASYAFAGMFERRAINVGNSYSLTFIFCCLFALRMAQVRLREQVLSSTTPSVTVAQPFRS